jgi:3-deoxy-manno-octulosonate cytidylyltransferase (CMP-KDO synthetase)
MSAIVAIPARIGSTRFPRKVLANLNGRSMLWHVYQGVSQAKQINEVWVLTDSQEVLDEVHSWGGKAMMTSEDCPSGTDRIASVAHLLDDEIIVNVQGDEPLISGDVVDRTAVALAASDADVATPVYSITDTKEITNPNVVKVVRAADGTALYFSRSAVPYVRDVAMDQWHNSAPYWGHVGLYALRRDVLMEYPKLPTGALEQVEKLEQLRLLEAGKRILAVEIDYRPHAVDTPEDLAAVKAILDERKSPR